jgi:hypothetical protein
VRPRDFWRVAVFALGLALALCPRSAYAQKANSAAAQALFESARDLMKKGKYAEAVPKLEESQRLDPGSGTLLNLGICYEHQGLTASAWTTYLEAVASARADGKADRAKSAQQHADALSPRLARLTIRPPADPVAGLEVRRDGTLVGAGQLGSPIPADPGNHVVAATAPGRKAWQTTVVLREGASETLLIPVLAMAASSTAAKPADVSKHPETAAPVAATPENAVPDDPGRSQRVVALVVGGVGVAGLAVGTVFGLRSKSLHDDAQATCTGAACTDDNGVNLMNEARAAGNVSTVAFLVGAAGVAVGATLWFTAPRGVQVGVGYGTMQIAGSW